MEEWATPRYQKESHRLSDCGSILNGLAKMKGSPLYCLMENYLHNTSGL